MALTNVERSRLSRRLDQTAQLGSDRLADIEPAAIDRPQPPQRRSEPEDAIRFADEIAEPLERGGKAQDRALIEPGRGRDLAQCQHWPLGMERLQHGKRPFDSLDLVVAHDHAPQCRDFEAY